MKVVESISAFYLNHYPVVEKLAEEVTRTVYKHKEDSWFFKSRIKKPESYALKLETGRYTNFMLEDFFGGTLVVENLAQIDRAVKMLDTHFDLQYKRPKNSNLTYKRAHEFQFDDLRLYYKIKQPENIASLGFGKIIFEIQVKTFLQHAWTIATHDLIYKSDQISWAKERVAYQIKASLEQAEIAISGVSAISSLPELAKEHNEIQTINNIIAILRDTFPPYALPVDILTLARTTHDILRNFGIETRELRSVLDTETNLGRGVHTLDLSPYGVIIQSIIYQLPEKFAGYFDWKNQKLAKIFVPVEVNINVNLANRSKLIHKRQT